MEFSKKRWFQLAAGLVVSLAAGIGYTWSVFQAALIDKFGWDLRLAALVYTIQIAASTLTPLFLGRFQARLGTRRYLLAGGLVYGACLFASGFASDVYLFMLVYGLGAGVGTGMIYPCLMGYGVRIFPDKPGLVAGLLAGAYGAGAVIWAPTAAALAQGYGIQGVYRIFGAAFGLVIAGLSFFLSDPPEGYAVPRVAKAGKSVKSGEAGSAAAAFDLDPRGMVRTPTFYLLLALFALGTTSGLMIMGHASSILRSTLSMTAVAAASIVGVISVFNALGRVVWGAVSDALGRFRVVAALFVLVGASMLVLSFADGAVFVGALMAVGFCYGGFAALIAPVTGDAFGPRHVTVNYGYLYIAYGIGGVFGPQIAAGIKGSTGAYSAAFVIVALCSVAGLVLTLLASRSIGKLRAAAGPR